MKGRRRRLLLAVGLGVLAALGVLWMRWRLEASYRTVEIILDGADWEALALREGLDPLEVLGRAAQRGATSIALYERTLERMAEQGEVAYLSGEEARAGLRAGALPGAFAPLGPAEVRPGTLYVAGEPETVAFLEGTFASLLGPERVRVVGGVLEVRGLRDDLEAMGLGFRPEDLERYRVSGLLPVLRLRNLPGLTAEGLEAKGISLRALGEGIPIVFELTDVLGYARMLPQTAEMLRQAGARFGRIEVFTVRRRQRGEEALARAMRGEVIRLFSLTPEELLVLRPPDARDKFVRAARERNIRLLYVRPFVPTAGVVGTESNLAFVDGITRDLRRFGLRAGRAAPMPRIAVPPLLWGGVALGAFAAMALTLGLLGEAVGVFIPTRLLWFLIALGLLITAAVFAGGPLVLWMKLLALGTAAAFPAAAVAAAVPKRPGATPVLAGIRTLWLASAGSIAAGLLVAALLTRWEFMMAADVFLGVKIAQLLPVVLVALMLWRYDRPVRSWRETAAELWEWSGHPLLVRYAVGVVIVGLAGLILLARSGNFGLPLLDVEERLRGALEDLLVARPRTKEYLIGHPALLLAGAAAAAGWRRWVMPLAVVGAIGQAGIVNSFSHIHTPLLYTVWRTVNALWLGTLLGTAAVLVLGWIAVRAAPPPPVRPRR